MDNKEVQLSIIVPIYNVGNYLEECLESLLNQGISSYEVIMVDDGSIDNSYSIVKRYANKYFNFYGHSIPNQGLGHARNYGANLANGEYITFVDSDDIIIENSYKKMIASLEKTGSDFVIGNVERFNSIKRFSSVLHTKVFRENKYKTHISEDNDLIYDTTAWNKVFRMDFWKKHDFKFPEGMLYEDIPVTIPAHILASSVDVLIDTVYLWRARDAGDNSITQQRNDINNLKDRLKAIEMVRQFFMNNDFIDGDVIKAFDYKNLTMDFPIYISYLYQGDAEYKRTYTEYLKEYLKYVNRELFLTLTTVNKIRYKLIMQNKLNELYDALENEKKNPTVLSPIKTNDGFVFKYPYIEILDSEEKKAVGEFEPVIKIEKLFWENMVLSLEGYAYIKNLNTIKKTPPNYSIILVDIEGNVEINLLDNQEFYSRNDVTTKFGITKDSFLPLQKVFNYNLSGYKFDVVINKEIFSKIESGYYYLKMVINNQGVSRERIMSSPVSGLASRPRYRMVDSALIYPKYNSRWELRLEITKDTHFLESIVRKNDSIYINGYTIGDKEYDLFVVNWQKRKKYRYPIIALGNGKFKASISIQKFARKNERGQWFFHLIEKGKDTSYREDLVLNPNYIGNIISCGINQLNIKNTGVGNLLLDITYFYPYLDKIELPDNDKFKLSAKFSKQYIHLYGVKDFKLELTNGSHSITFNQNAINYLDGIAIITFDISLDQKKLSYESSAYDVFIISDNKEGSSRYRIRINAENFKNYTQGIENRNYTLYRSKKSNFLRFRLSSRWYAIENGPRRREVIRKVIYPFLRLLPMDKKLAIYESYWGREFSCNPKAIYDYVSANKPEIKNVVFMKNDLVSINGNAEAIRIGSLKYYYYLSRAKYFFNNVNFGDDYRKRRGAIEIQTMHGTPLKKLGLDSPGEIPKHTEERFLEKCARWDYLTVPSDYVADITRTAFMYSGEIVNSGYPRNDALFKSNNEATISELKEKYNIPKDKKVILYAPTWRIKGKFSLPLDLNMMKEKISDDYILIIKLHHFSQRNFSLEGYEDFVFDLSSNSSIEDLYLIGDILITDYSSVMFDFSLLNKPMLFYTYDYDNYKNNLREMYFEFKEEAPGPLVEETKELVSEILDIENYYDKYKQRIEAFKNKYNQYDDGNATKKLLSRIFD